MWMQVGYTLKRDEIFDVNCDSSLAVKQACGDANLDNPANFTSDPDNPADCSDDAYWTSAVGTSLTYDKRNHPRNPTSGYYLQLVDGLCRPGWRRELRPRAG